MGIWSKIKKRFTIQNYNIGLVGGEAVERGIAAGDIRWLRHRYRDRFFADPFLWYRDEVHYYILAEELCFFEQNGRIVLLTVDKADFSLKKREVVLEEPWHLSFPYCEENGEEMMPEAVRSGQCVRYRLSKETHQVEERSVIAQCGIIDPIELKQGEETILLGSDSEDPNGSLYTYRKNGEGLYEKEKLLCRDKGCARNAGRLFWHKGSLMRPAQVCINRYGEATVVLRTEPDTLEQTQVLRMDGMENPPYGETLHTFNYYGDLALVDGSRDIFALRNIRYRARKYWKRRYGT